jgi:hypothetical protein
MGLPDGEVDVFIMRTWAARVEGVPYTASVGTLELLPSNKYVTRVPTHPHRRLAAFKPFKRAEEPALQPADGGACLSACVGVVVFLPVVGFLCMYASWFVRVLSSCELRKGVTAQPCHPLPTNAPPPLPPPNTPPYRPIVDGHPHPRRGMPACAPAP